MLPCEIVSEFLRVTENERETRDTHLIGYNVSRDFRAAWSCDFFETCDWRMAWFVGDLEFVECEKTDQMQFVTGSVMESENMEM